MRVMDNAFQAILFEKLQFPSQWQVRQVLESIREVVAVMERTDFVDRVPEQAQQRELRENLVSTRVALEALLDAMVQAHG